MMPTQLLTADALFQELLQYRDRVTDLSTLGSWLQGQVQGCAFPTPQQFPFQTDAYTRNCIAREQYPRKTNFEAFIMRWDQDVKTRIHGHPQFSFYHVISGMFEMEIFAKTATGLVLNQTRRFTAQESTWFVGQPGRYDNFIHRVTCLEPGLTFHVYSDDAQKGVAL